MASYLHVGAGATPATTSVAATVHSQTGTYRCRATQLTPAWDKLIPGEPVALDIEFQNFKHFSWDKWRHRVGRVAIVNSIGETILDVYAAYPREDGVRKLMPPPDFGVQHEDLMFSNGAVAAHKVERWAKQIVRDRAVILHGGTHDLTAFVIEKDVYGRSKVIDTQQCFSYLQFDGTPGLATTASIILGEAIQLTGHSPVEDAQTALKLWKQNHSFDRDAALAQSKAKRGDRANSSRSNHPGKKGTQTHQRRDQLRGVATASRAAARPLTAPNLLDDEEFPPLAAAGRKR